ncbi:MAG: hypothetical protein JWO03_551 [Bacteroidetes bacterium]|nr:hypothetical protein [Bacteroidota bacterium]
MLCIVVIGSAQAQTQTPHGCLAGELSQKQYDQYPERLIAKAQLDSFTREYIRHNRAQGVQRTGPYVVPVVFHIVHDAGAEDLSDATIYREMSQWNEYMSMTNPELPTVVPPFDTLIGNAQVEFRLAQIDPFGNCTNGIERIYSQGTYDGDDNNKQHPWPREKYLNVWVIKTMSRANNSALAYAYYPGSVAQYVNNDIIDGIIVMSVGVGTINDSWSRPTLAHECGHWMNLSHIWGNTNDPGVDCSGDDFVDDTPLTDGSYGSCNLADSSCTPGVLENTQNIMNYSSCHIMFTKGQVERMHAALNSPISGRTNLWSQTNLVATGTDQPLTYPNPNSCAVPVADFAVNNRYICSGQTVKFTDVSWNAEVQSRTWTFPADADLGSSTNTDVSPTVTFFTPGWQQVTLEVTNTNGSSQKVKSMVYVSDGSAIAAPYFEGFEDATASQANWHALNYDNNNTSFQYFTGVGHYSNACYRLNEYNALTDGDRDELVSPIFDLMNVDPSAMTLSFDYSFATYDANHMSDSITSLAVYGSRDCGDTWNRLYYNEGGFNLFNAGAFSTGPYVPGQQDEYWQNITINLPPAYQVPNFNFKFVLGSAKAANQFYVDNINIGQSPDGIGHVRSNISAVTIQPNPTQRSATLSLMNSTNTNATINMLDMTGREVMTLFNGQLQAGEKNISFDTQNISSGIYMIHVSDGKSSVQKRFVKM